MQARVGNRAVGGRDCQPCVRLYDQRSGRDRWATEWERVEAARPKSLDRVFLRDAQQKTSATMDTCHGALSRLCPRTPGQLLGRPQPGGCHTEAPAAVTHPHSRYTAAMVRATSVRGTVSREETRPEWPRPLVPAVPARQAQTVRTGSCRGWGGERTERREGKVMVSIRICAS